MIIAADTIVDDTPDDNPEHVIATLTPASEAAVNHVLAADPDSPDGRSGWMWVRLVNGDLILGIFPQGDTYFDLESEHS